MSAEPPWGPQGPPPGYQPPPAGPQMPGPVPARPPWIRRHWKLTAGLAVLVLVIVAIAAGSGGGGKGKGAAVPAIKVTPRPSATNPPPTATAPPPVALTSKQARFIRLFKAALAKQGNVSTASDSAILRSGETVCKLLAIESAAKIKRQTGADAATTGLVITAAEHSLCTRYRPRVLMTLSGSGQGASRPFVIASSPVKVHYSFDCSSQFGGDGNFIGDLESGKQSDFSSDDQNFANVIAKSGHKTTFVYAEDTGAEYHLDINSECNWSVTVKS